MIDVEDTARKLINDITTDSFTEGEVCFIVTCLKFMEETIFEERTDIEIETAVEATIAMFVACRLVYGGKDE